MPAAGPSALAATSKTTVSTSIPQHNLISGVFCGEELVGFADDAEFQSDAGTRSFGAKVNKDLPRLSIMSADDQGRMTKPIISAINGHANGGDFVFKLKTTIFDWEPSKDDGSLLKTKNCVQNTGGFEQSLATDIR